jgi:hypothetical protein
MVVIATYSDPIGLIARTNTYSYVGNKPISQVDAQGLSDILVIVDRTLCSAAGVLGNISLVINGELTAVFRSLELPWANNAPNKSSIPMGTYPAIIRDSPANGTVLQLQNVKNRDLIQIHKGNFTSNSIGCVLIGSSNNKSTTAPALTDSKTAFDTFMRAILSMRTLDQAASVSTSINVRISGCAG